MLTRLGAAPLGRKKRQLTTSQLGERPLIFTKQPIVVSFSPKSACTHVVTWYFLHERLLPAANYFHAWPHQYRTKVYYHSAMYQRRRETLMQQGPKNWILIKVTRDPMKRLVAIFRHAVRTPFADELALKRGINIEKDGLTLREFGEIYKGVDLRRSSKEADIHACSQIQPVWDLNFGRTITLNMDEVPLNDSLNDIERSVGLNITNFSAHAKFSQIRDNHYVNNDQDLESVSSLEDVRFYRDEVDKRFPKTALQNLPFTSELAKKLYPDDFAPVRTSDTKGELFQG